MTRFRSSAIYLDGYGSRIRKVSRCRPTVSNETILATKQEFFLYKSRPRINHNWHCTFRFLINNAPLNVYFILHYHLFFRKECLYFGEYDIRKFLFVFWLRNRPSMEGGSSKMCTVVYSGTVVSLVMCTYTLTLSLFKFLSCGVLFYL